MTNSIQTSQPSTPRNQPTKPVEPYAPVRQTRWNVPVTRPPALPKVKPA